MNAKKSKSKGRRAWLITWEGDDAERINRPKVVTALPPQVSEKTIGFVLETLYRSEYPLTLCEKIEFGLARRVDKPRYLRYAYRDINPELHYGNLHCYLQARMVKNLLCEESVGYPCECKLSWTELEKYRYVNNPLDPLEKPKVVVPEKQGNYTSKHP